VKIYSNGIEIGEMEDHPNDRRMIFPKLVGLNIAANSQIDVQVEPVYQSLLFVQKHGDIIFIDICLKKPVGSLLIMLKPFRITFVKPKGYFLEEG